MSIEDVRDFRRTFLYFLPSSAPSSAPSLKAEMRGRYQLLFHFKYRDASQQQLRNKLQDSDDPLRQ